MVTVSRCDVAIVDTSYGHEKGCFASVKRGVSALASFTWSLPAKFAGTIVGTVGSYVATNAAVQAFAIGAIYGYLSKASFIEPQTEKNFIDKGFDFIQSSLVEIRNQGVESGIQVIKANYSVATAVTGFVSGMIPFGNVLNGVIGAGIGYASGTIAQDYIVSYLPKEEVIKEFVVLMNKAVNELSPAVVPYAPFAVAALGAVATYLGVKCVSQLAQTTLNKGWNLTGRGVVFVAKVPFKVANFLCSLDG